MAALDAFRGYASALAAGLPGATRVLDAFHVVRLGLSTVDAVRQRVQQDTLGHRGRAADPLYRARRLARIRADRLNQHARARLAARLNAGDPNGEVTAAWIIAQDLMRVYNTATPPAAAEPRCRSSPAPWTAQCPKSSAWVGPCTPGRPSSSPTSPPDAPPTAPPKQSTSASKPPGASPFLTESVRSPV